jgi:hypothetical protein
MSSGDAGSLRRASLSRRASLRSRLAVHPRSTRSPRRAGPFGCGLNAFWGVALAKTDDAEAGALALSRVRPVTEDGLDELPRLGADGLSLGDEPRADRSNSSKSERRLPSSFWNGWLLS